MENIPKICIISSWFPNKERPSLAPFVYLFVKNLAASGVDVSVITTLNRGDSYFENMDGFEVYRVNKLFPLLAMFKIINKINPGIIHVHAPNYFGAFSLLIGKLRKIPVIATVHRAEIDKTNFFLTAIRRIILLGYHNIIAVSQYSKQLAILAGARNSQVRVVYNTCNEFLLKPQPKLLARSILGLPADKKILLFVGNLIRLKGIFTLIDALDKLRDKIDYHAVIVGTGKDGDELKDLIYRLNLESRITLAGWSNQSEISKYYNASDIFVLPSFVEGNSVAILEAMFLGIPVIASNTGGNPEVIINGENGYLVRVRDSTDLANKIEDMLGNEHIFSKFSKNCKTIYLNKFNSEKQIDEYLKIYQEVAKKMVS